ncbi:hypothetical protein IE81DRAFT_325362 [Ceraceosorus guamensis]|uniref:Uncharacterized protein n=1 Tax=Ceraceosorus guamensis TaxID=1522189 RepID=A0A316VYS1_9BASI|nr:hypothetical protein IE81DRAFT_325362 [Ceraceosorus guamensis]PWN40625.1 hypothetical protein IE81DRAFT_325362 [Ceraceosorus guamensis]
MRAKVCSGLASFLPLPSPLLAPAPDFVKCSNLLPQTKTYSERAMRSSIFSFPPSPITSFDFLRLPAHPSKASKIETSCPSPTRSLHRILARTF